MACSGCWCSLQSWQGLTFLFLQGAVTFYLLYHQHFFFLGEVLAGGKAPAESWVWVGWLFTPWITGGWWRYKAGVWNRNCILGSYPSNHLEVSAQCNACISNALYIYGKEPREKSIGNSRELPNKPVQALGLLFLFFFFSSPWYV